MRLPRLRRALGPLEPVLAAWYRRARLVSWWRPRAVVVVAAGDLGDDELVPVVVGAGRALPVLVTAGTGVRAAHDLGLFVLRVDRAEDLDDALAWLGRDLRITTLVDHRP